MRRIATLLFAILALAACHAPALAEKRVALVIGNGAYQNVPRLANPVNDANDMRAKLNGFGFQLFGGVDLDRNAMVAALTAFGRAAEGADVALVFYAGHGLQVNGQSYLVPTDARVEYEAELDFALVPFASVLQQLSRGSRINIAMLDACRDNPFAQNLSRSMGTRAVGALGRGLSATRSPSGTFIAYATDPDNVAQDGEGRNSPFTTALLKHIDTPGLSLPDLMVEVRNEVMKQTNGKQRPWDTSSMTGRFSFKIEGTITVAPAGAAPPAPAVAPPDRSALELAVWTAIQNSADRSVLEKFLKDFPDGLFAGAVREKLARLDTPPAPTVAPAIAPPATEPPRGAVLPAGMTLEQNIDRKGLDYRRDENVASPELCAIACAREARCRAYSWVRPGVQGPGAMCWLKTGASNPVAASFAVSGVKLEPAAPDAGLAPPRQSYSYVTGLNPRGDNWLALKTAPDINAARIAQMPPDTLLTVLGQSGEWLHVRLRNGSEGWASSRYIACCRNN